MAATRDPSLWARGGSSLYQAYTINVDQNVPLSINAGGGTDFGGTVGQTFFSYFFVSGGAAPFSWSVASGQLPPGLTLQSPLRAARRRR